MIKPESLFTEEDKKRIADAVKEAETRTSGEIVPYIVGQSDSYPEAWLRGGSLFAFFVLFVFSVINIGTDWWLPFSIAEVGALTVVAFGIGAALAVWVPVMRRAFIPDATEQQRVDERAAIAFLEEEVFSTRERTGILIFLSLFERRVRILGDTGINELVKKEEWDEIVQIIVQAMKNGVPAEGMLEAVWKCGHLLERRGVEIRADDANELDNSIRFSDK
ncbi:MAG: TPM domain-containing protein [Bacteroidetes bacterium]|nr:TPM domain-containing protein [Bacteroidota bacterium]